MKIRVRANRKLTRWVKIHSAPTDGFFYSLLPTVWRTVQHYGVEVHGLHYDGDILNDFRNQKSVYGKQKGKWPIRYDPRDVSRVFFYDDTLNQWHELRWINAGQRNRPFSRATLAYAKRQVLSRGGNPSNHDDLTAMLQAIFNRIDDHVIQDRQQKRVAQKEMMDVLNSKKDHSRLDQPFCSPDDEEDRYQPAGALAAMPLTTPDTPEADAIEPERSFEEVRYGAENDDDLF